MCGSYSAFWRLAATMDARLALIEGELLFLAAQITAASVLLLTRRIARSV
jgi:hypothetical protein